MGSCVAVFTPIDSSAFLETSRAAASHSFVCRRVVHAGPGRENRYLERIIEAVAALPERYILDMYLTPNNAGYICRQKREGAGVARTPVARPRFSILAPFQAPCPLNPDLNRLYYRVWHLGSLPAA